MFGFRLEVITGDTLSHLVHLVWWSLALPCGWKWLPFILFCLGLCICTPASLTIHLSFYTQVSFVPWQVYPVLPWWLACSILKFWFSQDPCPSMGWLGHMVLCCWVSESPSVLFSRVDALTYIPTWGRRVPFSPHPFQHLLLSNFWDGHADWCEVISHWTFDLHFSND